MKIPFFQVDAFTNKLFGGNPAGVCPLNYWVDIALMQNIAAENNLAETAFFVRNNNNFDLKWFTPETEIDLCGHATLAAAHIIFNRLDYSEDTIRFNTKSGELIVTKAGDLLSLNFPARKPVAVDTPDMLVKGLGARPIETLKARDYLAVFNTQNDILSITPDFTILKKLDCVGIIVTAKGEKADFISRFFAPAVGVDEDPVTGSSHVSLIPYWAEKLNKTKLHAYQLSKRKGEIFCEHLGNRVIMSGKSVIYLTGEIEI